MTQLLAVKNLTISSGERTLLDNFSFSIDAGEKLGLIGESGSGKSLTALALLGLLPQNLTVHGSVIYSGNTQIIGTPERSLNKVRGKVASIVFQEPLTALDPLMPVGKQIALALQRKGLSRRDVDSAVLSAISEVAIHNPERIARSLPFEISGGERQRIAIAMALASNPDLLIADEPTTALDVTVQAEVLRLITEVIENRGKALLFISHDLAVVSQVTQSVLVLHKGEEVERGILAEIIQSPKTEYTAELIASARKLDRALEEFGGALS